MLVPVNNLTLLPVMMQHVYDCIYLVYMPCTAHLLHFRWLLRATNSSLRRMCVVLAKHTFINLSVGPGGFIHIQV